MEDGMELLIVLGIAALAVCGARDPSIRGGMAGPPTFYAEGAGQAIGTPATIPDPARCVSVGVVQLAKGSRA